MLVSYTPTIHCNTHSTCKWDYFVTDHTRTQEKVRQRHILKLCIFVSFYFQCFGGDGSIYAACSPTEPNSLPGCGCAVTSAGETLRQARPHCEGHKNVQQQNTLGRASSGKLTNLNAWLSLYSTQHSLSMHKEAQKCSQILYKRSSWSTWKQFMFQHRAQSIQHTPVTHCRGYRCFMHKALHININQSSEKNNVLKMLNYNSQLLFANAIIFLRTTAQVCIIIIHFQQRCV